MSRNDLLIAKPVSQNCSLLIELVKHICMTDAKFKQDNSLCFLGQVFPLAWSSKERPNLLLCLLVGKFVHCVALLRLISVNALDIAAIYGSVFLLFRDSWQKSPQNSVMLYFLMWHIGFIHVSITVLYLLCQFFINFFMVLSCWAFLPLVARLTVSFHYVILGIAFYSSPCHLLRTTFSFLSILLLAEYWRTRIQNMFAI